MESLLDLAAFQPTRTLSAGDVLIAQGESGGDLFVLESGKLRVERDDVGIATIATPSAMVGEMSVVLGTPATATVKAIEPTTVRLIKDARAVLAAHPELAFRIAHVMATRLDLTSSLLADLTRQHSGKTEQGLLSRIFSALNMAADDSHYAVTERNDLFGGATPR